MRHLMALGLVLAVCASTACDGGSENEPGADGLQGNESDAASMVGDVVAVDTQADASVVEDCLLAKQWLEYPAGPKQGRRYEYDAKGNVILEGIDNDCDGVEEQCDLTEWDDAGRKTADYRDADCDGTIDSMCIWWAYDDAAASMTWTEDYDCDGIPEFLRTYVYDAEGRVVLEAVEEGEESGFAAYCYAYSYDEFGNEIEKKSGETCDGPWAYCQVSVFDEEGVQTETYQDQDCDGIPDKNCRVYEITTDADGVIDMSQSFDSECDGEIEFCSSTVATQDWYVLASSHDDGCDGLVESCYRRVFDADGDLLYGEHEEPCGAEPSICAEAFTLDVNGQVTTRKTDGNCDGEPEECETFVYDDEGRVVEFVLDEDCDGHQSPWCEFFEYDAQGNQRHHRTEQVCGDDYVFHEYWEYDCP